MPDLAVLDASVMIAFWDSADAHHGAAVAALRAHQDDELILPASAYAETLVGPSRHGPTTIASFEELIADLAIRVEPITREIARRAASLRAQHPVLRLPDALVLATGDALDAATLLTGDRAWAKISRRVQLL